LTKCCLIFVGVDANLLLKKIKKLKKKKKKKKKNIWLSSVEERDGHTTTFVLVRGGCATATTG
jgi:hypothetical protein